MLLARAVSHGPDGSKTQIRTHGYNFQGKLLGGRYLNAVWNLVPWEVAQIFGDYAAGAPDNCSRQHVFVINVGQPKRTLEAFPSDYDRVREVFPHLTCEVAGLPHRRLGIVPTVKSLDFFVSLYFCEHGLTEDEAI